jgi:hypothetical protein
MPEFLPKHSLYCHKTAGFVEWSDIKHTSMLYATLHSVCCLLGYKLLTFLHPLVPPVSFPTSHSIVEHVSNSCMFFWIPCICNHKPFHKCYPPEADSDVLYEVSISFIILVVWTVVVQRIMWILKAEEFIWLLTKPEIWFVRGILHYAHWFSS